MDSADDVVITINQLANRLENSTVSERIDALQELQRLARSNPDSVGAFSLKKVLDFLQEQSSAEEYQEALDLIYKLVKCRDKTAAKLNTDCILAEISAVELLLDLLEHQDPTVGVMSSQILSVLHGNNGKLLESQVQECPDGMNKLLQRLPDSSREEVRNEAIVLIQQLTSRNEEMKKTVVFNDGFEILFRIIQSEGGHKECGLVISSCLHICSNILDDSETCQRLFFAMGGDWILQLASFFDPLLLESFEETNLLIDESAADDPSAGAATSSSCWFDDSNRLLCAILALNALFNALSTPSPQHCVQMVSATSVFLPSLGHWIARRGPAELVNVSIALLRRLIDHSGEQKLQIGNKMAELIIKVAAVQPRKNFPPDLELPSLSFGWRPVAADERRLITLLSLLAERYVYPAGAWQTCDEPLLADGAGSRDTDVMALAAGVGVGAEEVLPAKALRTGDGEVFAAACISVFESIICVDPNISDFIIQYVLAPPPPPAVDGVMTDSIDSSAQAMGVMRPLGALVMQLLVDGCLKVMDSAGGFTAAVVPIKGSSFDSLVVASRAANLLTVIFLSGSQLAKELMTAVTTSHVAAAAGRAISATETPKSLLLLLLSAAGRAARLPQGSGYQLLVSILRTLATIASNCEFAARQMLEDPSNLFVVDIATAASEAAGVPAVVQIISCLFLGCCFESIPPPPAAPAADGAGEAPKAPAAAAAAADTDTKLNRRSFLSMIDSRIGLNRFTDILKRPLVAKRQIHSSGSNLAAQSYASSLFISDGFKRFYEQQVDAIRTGLFDFYTGSLTAAIGDGGDPTLNAAQQQVIEMQQERIAELEAQLQSMALGAPPASSTTSTADSTAEPDASAASIAAADAVRVEMAAALQEQELAAADLQARNRALEEELATLREERSSSASQAASERQLSDEKLQDLQAQLQLALEAKQVAESGNASLTAQFRDALQRAEQAEEQLQHVHTGNAGDKQALAAKEDEILSLKQRVLDESAANKLLKETLDHRERKIELLLEELKAGSPSRGDANAAAAAERKVADLENRNAALQQQLWEKEAELDVLRTGTATTDVSIELKPSLEVLVEAVLSMVSNLEIDIEDLQNVKMKLEDDNYSFNERSQLLDYILNECCQKINSAVGECSDIAEGAGLFELDGSEGSVERFVSCCRQLRKQLQDVSDQSKGLAEYQQQIADLELLYGESEIVKSELIERIDGLEQQLQSLPADGADRVAALEAELESLAQAKRDLEAQLAAAQEQLRAAKSTDSPSADADSKDETAQKELLLLQEAKMESDDELRRVVNENEELKATVADLQSKLHEQHEVSEEELGNVNLACDVLQERLDTAAETISRLEAELSAARCNAATGSEAEREIAALKAQLDEQTAELRAARMDYNTLAEELDAAQQTIAQMEEAARKSESQLDEMRSALEDAEGKSDSLEVATHHLQHELDQAKRRLVDSASAAQKELAEVRAQLEQAEAKRDSLEVQVKHLQHQLDLSQRMGDESSGELQQELEKMSSANMEADMRINEMERKITELQAQLQEANDAADRQLEVFQSDIAAQKKETKIRDERFDALTAAAKAEIGVLQNAADAANAVVKRMAEQMKLLQSELAMSRRKGDQLQREAEAAIDELSHLKEESRSSSSLSQVQLDHLRAEHAEELRKAQERAAAEVDAAKKNLEAAEDKVQRATGDVKALEGALQKERAYLNEAEAALETARAASAAEIQRLKSQNQQLTSTMEDLAAKISTQEKYIADMYAQQARSSATEHAMERELEELRKAVGDYEAITKNLEAEKTRAEELLRAANGDGSGIDAFRAQETELHRITKSFDQLSRDLCAKDQQLQHVLNMLQRREGEAAGVMATMDGIKTDLELLREENAQLNDALAASQRQAKDAEREMKVLKSSLQLERSQSEGLRSQLQSEKHRHRSEDAQAAHHSDVMRAVEAQLKDVIAWLVKTHHIGDYVVTNGKGEHGFYAVSISSKEGKAILEPSLLIETVRNCIFWIQRTRDSELRAKNSLLHEKERELNSSQRSLQALTDQLAAARRDVEAAKAAAAAAEAAAAAAAARGDQQRGRGQQSNGKENVRSSSAPATPNRTASSWISTNSAAKEAARLNSELMKEKRKLSNLQQQHSDLLALLAQQEVELNVFRTALEKRLTSAQLQQLQSQAQKESIELYGSYTNFR